MATQLQIRRGTNTQNASFTGAEGELSANTTNDSVHVHDGSTAGGFELARADLNNVSDTDLNTALTGNTVSALTITTLTLGSTAITATGAELNILDGVTATATELNILDGVTATTAELNYVDGVTSSIQTQIDAKAPLANPTFTGSFTSPGIDDNADATAITIDSSEQVGIGETAPEGLMHIKKGNSGTTYSTDAADQLILENSGSVMMDIRTPTGNTGGILFSDAGARGRGVIQYAHSNDTMYFNTGGAARFQMSENSCQSLLSLVAGSATYADDPFYAQRSNTGKLIRLYQGSTEVGYISTNTYSLPSDRNFKKDIEDLPLGLELVKSLRPKQYRQKIDEHNSPLQAGLIAQDFEEALTAQGVESNKYIMLQETPNDDETQSQYAVDYVKLVPVLINAIQEQQTLIESLTDRIAALENN